MKAACLALLLLITFYDFMSVIFRLFYPDLQTAATGILSFMTYLPYISFDLGPEPLMTLLLIVFVPLMITGFPLILYVSRVKRTRHPRIMLMALACLNIVLSVFALVKLKVGPNPDWLQNKTVTQDIFTGELILLIVNLIMFMILNLRIVRRWFARGR